MWLVIGVIGLIFIIWASTVVDLKLKDFTPNDSVGEIECNAVFATGYSDIKTASSIAVQNQSNITFAIKKPNILNTAPGSTQTPQDSLGTDTNFRKKCSVITKDPRVKDWLDNDAEAQDIITQLMDFGDKIYSPEELICEPGEIRITFEQINSMNEEKTNAVLKTIVPLLSALNYQLRSTRELTDKETHDLLKATKVGNVIGSVSKYLAAYGLISFIVIALNDTNTVDTDQIYSDAMVFTLSLMLPALALAFYATRNYISQYSVLVSFLLFGLVGLYLTIFSTMWTINIDWDKSPKIVHNIKILDKKRDDGNDYLLINDLSDHDRTRYIIVPVSLFDTVKAGDAINITQNSGYLGYEWLGNPVNTKINLESVK